MLNPWKILVDANHNRQPDDMVGLRFIAKCAENLVADPFWFGLVLIHAAKYANRSLGCWFGAFRYYVVSK